MFYWWLFYVWVLIDHPLLVLLLFDINFIVLISLSPWFLQIAAYTWIFSVAFRDTPRKRSAALSGSSVPGRSVTTASSISAEPQPEEAVNENFPVSSSVMLGFLNTEKTLFPFTLFLHCFTHAIMCSSLCKKNYSWVFWIIIQSAILSLYTTTVNFFDWKADFQL